MSRYDASSDGSVGHRANAVTSEDDDDNDDEGGSSLAMFERESLPGPETPLPEGTRVRKLQFLIVSTAHPPTISLAQSHTRSNARD
jgi:hypothetical protein